MKRCQHLILCKNPNRSRAIASTHLHRGAHYKALSLTETVWFRGSARLSELLMYKTRKEAVLSLPNRNQKRLTGSRVWFSGDRQSAAAAEPEVRQSAEATGDGSGWIKASCEMRWVCGMGNWFARLHHLPVVLGGGVCCINMCPSLRRMSFSFLWLFNPSPLPHVLCNLSSGKISLMHLVNKVVSSSSLEMHENSTQECWDCEYSPNLFDMAWPLLNCLMKLSTEVCKWKTLRPWKQKCQLRKQQPAVGSEPTHSASPDLK